MKKILIAEDDREINRLICEYLSGQEYEMLQAMNGLDALRIVRDLNELSLLILDLMLPFQSGDMVLQKIREFSDIPVIVVSAKSETSSKIELIRMGADDYITKPFNPAEVTARKLSTASMEFFSKMATLSPGWSPASLYRVRRRAMRLAISL